MNMDLDALLSEKTEKSNQDHFSKFSLSLYCSKSQIGCSLIFCITGVLLVILPFLIKTMSPILESVLRIIGCLLCTPILIFFYLLYQNFIPQPQIDCLSSENQSSS